VVVVISAHPAWPNLVNALRLKFGFLAVVAIGLVPAGAARAEPVPPGNPAAVQYTEAIPTAGGQQDAENGKKPGNRQPSQVLGDRNAQRLESQGEAGREAAEAAAETAPAQSAAGSAGTGGGGGKVGGTGSEADAQKSAADGAGDPGGSGLGEVVGQASGASSLDASSLLLPLAILGVFIWSLAYLLRRRKNPTE
jgi:hypothetical protein